jgi:hypothetical protein
MSKAFLDFNLYLILEIPYLTDRKKILEIVDLKSQVDHRGVYASTYNKIRKFLHAASDEELNYYNSKIKEGHTAVEL